MMARMIKKYNILKSTYLMKLYIVFLIDFELLFRQPRAFLKALGERFYPSFSFGGTFKILNLTYIDGYIIQKCITTIR